MNRQQLNMAVPMVYGILVVAAALFFSPALVAVAVIGAMLVGLYYAVGARTGGAPTGRDRQRNRNRSR